MNEAQQQYINAFYLFFQNERDDLDWHDIEFYGTVLGRAKSMRFNVNSFDDPLFTKRSFDDERFTKREWIEILNNIISECT